MALHTETKGYYRSQKGKNPSDTRTTVICEMSSRPFISASLLDVEFSGTQSRMASSVLVRRSRSLKL